MERLNIKLPIIQAPMAGVTTPHLIAGVANNGALGSLAAGYMSPHKIAEAIHEVRKLTDKPFAVNLFVPEKHYATDDQIRHAKDRVQEACQHLHVEIPLPQPPYAPSFNEQLEVIIAEKIPVLSFTFGIPDEKTMQRLKQHKIITIGTATTLAEATLLEQSGVDFITAQGAEAGGHRGTFLMNGEEGLINLSTLLQRILAHVKIPVIAAGGIMNAVDIKKVLDAGATAVQMGTAFLCCTEASTHPAYKNLLLNSSNDQTVLTRAFSGKLARGIRNKFIQTMENQQNAILDYPIQNSLTVPMRRSAQEQNNTEYMSMWAGQGMQYCTQLRVEELIKELSMYDKNI